MILSEDEDGFVYQSVLFEDFLKNLLRNDSFARYELQNDEKIYLKMAVLIIAKNAG